MTAPCPLPKLYPHQLAQVDEIRATIRAGHRRVLLVSPTGSGKGTIATWMIHKATERKSRVLFLVNRRELVKDTSRRLDRLGVDHGVIMGDHPRRKPWLNIHVASIDTLQRREVPPPADLIFADECHFSISPTWRKVLDRYTCPVIGMSATPIRADGRGLGEFFDAMVSGPSVRDLMDRGFLVPARIFAPAAPELETVTVSHGEYNQKQLARAVDRSKIIGDVVAHWLKIARGRPTVVFAVSVEHSRHIVDQFTAAGIRAVHVDADTPDEERDRIWAGLADGSIQICSSVGVISYGWDVPPVSCAILARPTKSLALYLQQIGRVLRTHPTKTDALILDHAGCCLEHGFPDDEREWTLDGVRKRFTGDIRGPSVRMCKNCWAAHSSNSPRCPFCGWEPEKQDGMPDQVDGSLTEVTEANRPAYTIRKLSTNPRIAELQNTAAEKGYKPGWVWFQIQRLKGRTAQI
jgi:superfamily II DNA or RNA helicase